MINAKTPSPSKRLQNTFTKAHLHAFTPPIWKGGMVKVVGNERLHLQKELNRIIAKIHAAALLQVPGVRSERTAGRVIADLKQHELIRKNLVSQWEQTNELPTAK